MSAVLAVSIISLQEWTAYKGFRVFIVWLQWQTLQYDGFNLISQIADLIYAVKKLQDKRGGEITGSGIIQAHLSIQAPTLRWCGLGEMPYYLDNEHIALILQRVLRIKWNKVYKIYVTEYVLNKDECLNFSCEISLQSSAAMVPLEKEGGQPQQQWLLLSGISYSLQSLSPFCVALLCFKMKLGICMFLSPSKEPKSHSCVYSSQVPWSGVWYMVCAQYSNLLYSLYPENFSVDLFN